MGIRRLLAAAIVTAALFPVQAEAKKIVVIRGIAGNVVSPMTSIIMGLRARGHRVVVREWFQGVPPRGFDVAIGHSAGDRPALLSGAPLVITLDPTWANPGCQRGSRCVNYYAPIDAFPLIVCCGGYRVSGAANVVVSGGHILIPEQQARRVVALAK